MMFLINLGLMIFVIVRWVVLPRKLGQPRFDKGQPGSLVLNGVSVPYRYTVSIGSENPRNPKKGPRSASLTLALKIPDCFRFLIRRETKVDRLARLLGIARDWQTQDPEFDAKAYVLSDDPLLHSALSRSEVLRKTLMALLSEHEEIHCAHGRIWIDLRRPVAKEVKETDFVRQQAGYLLPQFIQVRDELMSVGPDKWKPTRDPGLREQSFVVKILLLLGLLAIVGYLSNKGLDMPRQLLMDGTIRHAQWLTAIGSGVLIGAPWALMRMRSRRHLVLLELLLVGVPSVWFVASAASEVWNRRFDGSPPREIEVQVEDAYTQDHNKGRDSYYLAVSGWPDKRAITTLKVSGSLYYHFQEAGHRYAQFPICAHVQWHAGRLGDPWISEFVPAKCAKRRNSKREGG
jgi:hypothetical protein